jgi:hypothetical protein
MYHAKLEEMSRTGMVRLSRLPDERGRSQRGSKRTKISSAESDFVELLDMAPGDLKGGGGWSRNGFRETGRAGGSSNGEAGEVARLRKGLLLEEKLRVRPADACESVAMGVSGASDQQLPSGRMQLIGTGGGRLGVMGTDETGQSPRHDTTEQRKSGPTPSNSFLYRCFQM